MAQWLVENFGRLDQVADLLGFAHLCSGLGQRLGGGSGVIFVARCTLDLGPQQIHLQLHARGLARRVSGGSKALQCISGLVEARLSGAQADQLHKEDVVSHGPLMVNGFVLPRRFSQ